MLSAPSAGGAVGRADSAAICWRRCGNSQPRPRLCVAPARNAPRRTPRASMRAAQRPHKADHGQWSHHPPPFGRWRRRGRGGYPRRRGPCAVWAGPSQGNVGGHGGNTKAFLGSPRSAENGKRRALVPWERVKLLGALSVQAAVEGNGQLRFPAVMVVEKGS